MSACGERLAHERDEGVVSPLRTIDGRPDRHRRPRCRRCRRRPALRARAAFDHGPEPHLRVEVASPRSRRSRAERGRRRGAGARGDRDVVAGALSSASGRIMATLEPTKSTANTIHSDLRRNASRSSRAATSRVAAIPGHAAASVPSCRRPRGTAPTGSAPRPRSRPPARDGRMRRGPHRDRREVRGAAGCRGVDVAIVGGRPVDPRRVDVDVDAQPADSGSPPSACGGRRAARPGRGAAG